MPKFSQLSHIVTSTWKRNPGAVFHIEGSPGTGKTALTLHIAKEMGIEEDRVLIFRPSLHDPVDLMGIPKAEGGVTSWNPPAEFYKFRNGTGPGLIIWDELPQATTMMQNAIAGALLDKFIGPLTFDPLVCQITTGNRTKDKAGANRMVTQLGNRVNIQEFEVSLDESTQYFMDKGVDAKQIAFLRLRPDLLNDFDPEKVTNPTPRSWDMAFSSIPEDLPVLEYQAAYSGYVGSGPAAEWVASREIMNEMPNIDVIFMDPSRAELPTKPAIKYAVSTAMAMRTDDSNFDRAWEYMKRMQAEFHMVYMTDVIRRYPKLKTNKTFIDFALKNQSIFLGA